MKPLRSAFIPLLVAVFGSAALLHAENATSQLELPPLEARSSAIGTVAWQYTAVPGYEVLTRCSPATTRQVLKNQVLLDRWLAAVVPEEFRPRQSASQVFILDNQQLANPETKTVEGAPVRWLSGSLLLADRDLAIAYLRSDETESDPDSRRLARDRVFHLLEARRPRLPAWLIDGIGWLAAQSRLQDDAIGLDPALWVDAVLTEDLRAHPDFPHPSLALPDLLEGGEPRPSAENEEARRLWNSEAALFVRWALDGDASRRAAFWNFVRRTTSGGASDAVCRECFGFGYADLRDRLSDYLPRALITPMQLDRGSTALPEVVLRPATSAEIGWLKGDWERLEIAYVKGRYPQHTDRYIAQARQTLTDALAKGDRDPRLLAVLGLLEADLGNNSAARQWLEVAATPQLVRPRAFYELARMRYLAALSQPAEANGLLSVAQVNGVLEPLKSGYRQAPPLLENYRLAAQAWGHSVAPLGPGQLALLDDGLRFFPDELGLLYDVAALKMLRGLRSDALSLANRGASLTTDAKEKARFTKLVERMSGQ
jgi:hypothetical protein